MNAGRVMFHLAKADFLERVRRYSFLVTLGMTLYFGYLAGTGKLMLRMGNVRGVYNSAWIGGLMAMVAGCFLSLAGFYVVKNTVQRDRETRVGQILAATPITKFQYALGKVVSNFAVLSSMVVVLALSGIAMQCWQGEDPHIQLWRLLAPFVFLALPMMALVAAVAILFETIPFLSGGFGNVVYFFFWTAMLTLPIATESQIFDPSGLFVLANSMLAAANSSWKTGGFSLSLDFGVFKFVSVGLIWNGVAWTRQIILLRLLWLGVALLLTGVSALFFDRFASSREKSSSPNELAVPDSQLAHPPGGAASVRSLSRLGSIGTKTRFGAMVAAEIRLMLKGKRWWWYLVAAGLVVAGFASPLESSRGGVLVAAWIWPMLIWSQMGAREARNNTASLIFTAPNALVYQLFSIWTAGLLVALLTGAGSGLRLLASGDWAGTAGWLAGAAFIPSLALAFGVWSGTSKLFEAIYTVWWYVGPAHHTPGLDFAGTSPASARPLSYLILSGILLGFAYVGRRARLAYA